MREDGAGVRERHWDSPDSGLGTPLSGAEPPSPACRAWEDKLPPQTVLINLFMLVSFHLCFITLPSRSEGEKSQTRVAPAALCSWEDNAGK